MNHQCFRLFAITLLLLTSACANMSQYDDPDDPLEAYNRAIYTFNDKFDKTVAQPVAGFYKDVVPIPVDKGITNFFSNLDDVIVLLNDLLQLKFTQAAQDTARFFFNSTIGLLGFFDVASAMDLPKHNEDFGQTLGYWGVPPGPYLVLPFLGPSTIRDAAGLGTDYLVFDPLITQVDETRLRWGLFALEFIDWRADNLTAGVLLEEAALDPYVFMREAYLQRRLNRVYDGEPPMEEFDDYEDEQSDQTTDEGLDLP